MPKLDKTPELDTADGDFDIDAWIDGASTETQTVRIYRNLGKLGEYQRLEQEFINLQNQLGSTPEDEGTFSDAALGEVTPQTKLVELAPRMKQVYDTLQADALWVTVRGFGDDELDAMRKEVDKGTEPKDKKSEALAFRFISDGATFRTDNGHEFTMSAKKLRAFRNAIGDKQFNKITGAAYQVNGFNGDTDVVMPDFSPGASAYLATKES
ncbi:hypothetical protein [Flexivirga sp.]|uniref:hypothetical protein n=1 Tax=Flexivirga sp. TaxID=1962927 RepID=UPI003F7D17DE